MSIETGLQLRFWRYAIDGDVSEISALVCERPDLMPQHFDHDQAWLERLTVHTYGESRSAQPWAALPWLAEHCIRGHMDWPGL